jgi:hypothetical protein
VPPAAQGHSRTAQDIAHDAIDGASRAADSIRNQVGQSAVQQQQRAADTIDAVADSLQHSTDSLPDQQAWLSDLTSRGAAQLSDLADRLRRNDLQGLLDGVEGFARGQPALFFGASMAAGFAMARVAQVSVARTAASANPTPQPGYRTTAAGTDAPAQPSDSGTSEPERPATEMSHG